jgi:hypothetical protein
MRFHTQVLTAILFSGASMAAPAVTLTFDDLPTPLAVNALGGLFFANGNSAAYGGVVWEAGLAVGGAQFRVQTLPVPGPLFGIPHSGDYFLTNQGNGVSNDAMRLTTPLVLTGAWFGRNEYYGFGGGADRITINALQGSTVLGSVSLDLPELNAGQPEPLSFVDTSAFVRLTGITGYRIDRRESGAQSGNWVADDFTFIAAVPEPGGEMFLLGLVVACAAARRRVRGRAACVAGRPRRV